MNLDLRQDAQAMFQAALKAADPEEAIYRHVKVEGGRLTVAGRVYDLDGFRRVLVTGAGKAAGAMALAIERLLGDRIAEGFLSTKYGHTVALERVTLHECGHPVPDERGVEGAARIARLAEEAGAGDLLIALISGGASALTPSPAPPVTLDEKQATTRLLLSCGATIHEINCVRKHISLIKGGQLARLAQPAQVVALLLSDVIGDDLDVIGSGPTAPDSSTFEGALAILDRHGIRGRVPAAVRERLEAGERGEIEETPKPGDPVFGRVQNVVVGSNALAVDAAVAEARKRGYQPLVLSTFIEGETREVAKVHAAILKEVLANGRPLARPAAIVSGGETTVTLRGEGKGGRNQEFVLAAAIDLAGTEGIAVLSGGTDGTDGPTDAAGAIADGETVKRAAQSGLKAADYLARNDSYPFFQALGDLLLTGPTNTNVMDVRIMLAGPHLHGAS